MSGRSGRWREGHILRPTSLFRAGLIEKWGRGTNRVIEMCRAAGVTPPVSGEITGGAVVTFRVQVGVTAMPTRQVTPQVTTTKLESKLESLASRVLSGLKAGPLGKAQLAGTLGQRSASGALHQVVRDLLDQGLIERTIPDKPGSRLQRYRITPAGEEVPARSKR